PKRDKRRTVAYSLEHGDVVVALDPAQATLNEVIRALPEVKRIYIKITAAEDRRKVKIDSEAVLNTQIGTTALESRDLINQCILDTATDMLGLEVLGPINLKVKGAEVDVRAASESVREKHLSEIEAKKAAAAAVPEPEVLPAVPDPEPEILRADELLDDNPTAAPELYSSDLDLTPLLEEGTEKTDSSVDTGFYPEALPQEEVFPAGDDDDLEDENKGTVEDGDDEKKNDEDSITF
ncbi:MAG: hypothetical protein IH628_02320, partial [Proteobacteria bacterium]|nr:hypothetical protein [Pseudomonadota bacterium]